MQTKKTISILPWVSLGLIFIAVILTVFELIQYSRIRSSFSPGTVVAGIPVGGLDQQHAADRLLQAYSVPVEIHYGDAVIQIKPAVLGFELDTETMMTAADMARVNQSFWVAFWEYVWNRLPSPAEIPLRATISEDRLRAYLTDEIAARYDQPPSAAMPVPGSTTFQTGQSGRVLDIDRAVALVEDALRSPSNRVANLTYNQVSSPRPSLQNLQVLLQQIIDLNNFTGLAELYMLDLQTRQELHFAYEQGKNVTPDIAFTAASTMKIPIMVSVLRRVDDPAPKDVTDNLELMIERSENDPADHLVETVIDKTIGPLMVTDDMNILGLKNTFLAGYFYTGAPLLKLIQTPANQRTDINTSPDTYNQTTPAEMGMLLDDIYQCAQNGGGTFAAAFPGQLSQNKCRTMITYLTKNNIGVLLQAGLPEGTQIAHKHGWINEADGLIHTISDAGIIYSPGGNYVLVLYLHNNDQLVFDPANELFAQISTTIYNYFNQTGK